jgi:hypothetical protein
VNTYSLTYWAPGTTGVSVMSVNAHEFAFTETHVIFLNGSKMVIMAVPLTLQPIVRYAGPTTGAA